MGKYRDDILGEICILENERQNTPIWRVFKITVINEKTNRLGNLFKNDLYKK